MPILVTYISRYHSGVGGGDVGGKFFLESYDTQDDHVHNFSFLLWLMGMEASENSKNLDTSKHHLFLLIQNSQLSDCGLEMINSFTAGTSILTKLC